MGLAGNSRVCLLPGRSPDPGIDHLNKFFLRTSSMANGITVLGVDGIHYIHEYHYRKISTKV